MSNVSISIGENNGPVTVTVAAPPPAPPAKKEQLNLAEKMAHVRRWEELGCPKNFFKSIGVTRQAWFLWRKKYSTPARAVKKQEEKVRAAKKQERVITAAERAAVEVAAWIRQRADMHTPTTREQIDNFAKDAYARAGVKNFNASNGWFEKFKDRHKISLRRRTGTAQLTHDDAAKAQEIFSAEVIADARLRSVPLSAIGNMDETAVQYASPPAATYTTTGVKTAAYRNVDGERDRITVALAALADGTKLPAYVIFYKGDPVKKKENESAEAYAQRAASHVPRWFPKLTIPANVRIAFNASGYMDARLMGNWFNTVWMQVQSAALNQNCILTLDSFGAHKTAIPALNAIASNTKIHIIPPSTTSILQPMDVGINGPFKANLRRLYGQWKDANPNPNNAQKEKKMSRDQLLAHISEAWNAITADTVRAAFKRALNIDQAPLDA